jgi:hypothetical protein
MGYGERKRRRTKIRKSYRRRELPVAKAMRGARFWRGGRVVSVG